MNGVTITQCPGDARRDAIINSLGLDIVDEVEFFKYLNDMGYSIDDSDEIIISLHEMFFKNKYGE